MIEYDEEDLKEWSNSVWASVEYGGNGVKALKEFINWLGVEL